MSGIQPVFSGLSCLPTSDSFPFLLLACKGGRMLAKQNLSLLYALSIKNTGLSVLVLGKSSEPLVKWLQSPRTSLCFSFQGRLVEESFGRFLSRSTMHWSSWMESFCRCPLGLSFSLALSQQLWLASGRTEEPAGAKCYPWKLRCVFLCKWNK